MGGNIIDSEKVFTTISLFNLTLHPLGNFPWLYSQIKASIKSYGRICDFLSKKEKACPTQPINEEKIFLLMDIEYQKIKYSEDSEFNLEVKNFKMAKLKQFIVYD